MNLSNSGYERARALGFQVRSSPGSGNGPVTVMIVPKVMDALEAMHLMRASLPGEQFQLNRVYRLYLPARNLYQPAMKEGVEAGLTQPVPASSKKCSADRCYAPAAMQWNDRFSSCGRNVRIGIIDTDIDLKHPAFRDQKIAYKASCQRTKAPLAIGTEPGCWHCWPGGPIAALPASFQTGYDAAAIFYSDESGDTVTDTVSFLKALDWMADSGVKLVNMSFTGPRDDLAQKKIESMSARGVVFIAAAGNDGPAAEPAYPAAYPQVIAVTAVTKDLRNYPYANRGAHIDLAAPGVDIWTAWPEEKEGYRSGTSFASPFVTGVLAIYPPDVLRSPKSSLLDRLNISDLGAPGRDPIYGRGLLRAPASCPGNATEVAALR